MNSEDVRQTAVAFILHPDVWLSMGTHGLVVLESAPKDFSFYPNLAL